MVFEDGVGRAGDGAERVADFEVRGLRGGARVLDAVAVGVDLQRVEAQDAPGHAAWRGDAAEAVEHVVLVDDVEELAVARQGHRVRVALDGVDRVRADLRALDLRRGGEGVGPDGLAGDDEEGVAEGDAVARGLQPAFRLLEDRADRLGRLADVEDLALAHAGRGNLGVADDSKTPVRVDLADGEDGARGADFECGVEIAHAAYYSKFGPSDFDIMSRLTAEKTT